MGSQTILILAILAILAVQSVLCQVWEYGTDNALNQIIFHEKGHITFLEKVKEIDVNVPDCYKLDYVRVRVDNVITHPETDFDKSTHVVKIVYRPWQISSSTYDVIGKGVYTCYNQERELVTPNELV